MAAHPGAAPLPVARPHRRWPRRLLIGLLWLLGIVLVATSCVGYWPRTPWWVRVVTPFRFQFLLGGVALALLGLRMRRAWITRGLALTIVALNLLVLWPWLLPVGDHTAGDTFLLMSWNTWGNHPDPTQVVRAIQGSDADLVVLCETPTAWRNSPAPEIEGYECFTVSQYLLAAKVDGPVTIEWHGVTRNPDGLEAIVNWQGSLVRIFGIHAARPTSPYGVRLQDYKLNGFARHFNGERLPTIVAGDFNLPSWSPGLRDFLDRTGLRDASRGRGVRATFPADPPVLGRLVGVPIDHCFYTDELSTGSRRVGPAYGSNHRPLYVTLGWRSASN